MKMFIYFKKQHYQGVNLNEFIQCELYEYVCFLNKPFFEVVILYEFVQHTKTYLLHSGHLYNMNCELYKCACFLKNYLLFVCYQL